MRSYFAYTRVSTVKQGQLGSSLVEQRDAIEKFASRNELNIKGWYEERETAATTGRTEFTKMVAALKRGAAAGVIFHKIDRSARNLKDWSAVQDLADLGLDVRFTQEAINLGSNEGKLTGDFLAVISAHYIRNLREEVKKGIRGRLKQGLFPFRAFFGYLDQGGGKPKIPDPILAPFIKLAFELYAGGRFSLQTLSDELFRRGLRTKDGKQVGVNRLAAILRNPFYTGVIRLKTTGESFAGVHMPMVSVRTFELVQSVLDGKRTGAKAIVHEFLFRRLITCRRCGYRLIGETKKGHVYYRCHSLECRGTCLREEFIEARIRNQLKPFELDPEELSDLAHFVTAFRSDNKAHLESQSAALRVQLGRCKERVTRLTELYVDGAIEREVFQERKLALILDQQRLDEQSKRLASGKADFADELTDYLELLKSVPLSYETANRDEKRRLLSAITSNFYAEPKNVVVELKSPFRELSNLRSVLDGGPLPGGHRTKRAGQVFDVLYRFLMQETRSKEVA